MMVTMGMDAQPASSHRLSGRKARKMIMKREVCRVYDSGMG
jgi:hypothetical protein